MAAVRRSERIAAAIATAVYAAAFAWGLFAHLGAQQQAPAAGGRVATAGVWLHNVVVLLPLWAGIFSFGALTLLWLLLQGFAHGLAVGHAGMPPLQALGRVWLHGLFEVAAIILAATAGLVPGVVLVLENKIVLPWRRWPGQALLWLLLLALAAWLEGKGV